MAKGKVSLGEIAKQLNIASSTVSRALNGKPGVGESLRQEILEAAARNGYTTQKSEEQVPELSKNIAMIIGDIRNPFYADLVFAVQKELSARGYTVSIFNSEYDEKQELRYMQMLEHFHFDGIIEVCVSSASISAQLEELRIPIVMVNRMLPCFETDVVLLDNYEAGYIATRHLLEKGHTRIAFLLGQKNSSSSMMRYEGYLQMMKNYQVPVVDEYQLAGDLTMERGYQIAQQAFASWKEPPSAIVISNDLTAFGFLAYCNSAGIRVPDDISIVCFDIVSLSAALMPPLTSIDAHVVEMGKQAVEMMINRIEHPDSPTQRVILKPELIERQSVRQI